MKDALSKHLSDTAAALTAIASRIKAGEKPSKALPLALSSMRRMLDNVRDNHIRNSKMSGKELAEFWKLSPGRVSQIRSTDPEQASESSLREKMNLLTLMAQIVLLEEAEISTEELVVIIQRFEELKKHQGLKE